MESEYLRRIAEALEKLVELYDQRYEDAPSTDRTLDEESAPQVDWLTESAIPDLAAELGALADAEQDDPHEDWLDQEIVEEFWDSKGIESRFALSNKHQRILDKVEATVRKGIQVRAQEALARETESIPAMVGTCLAWASSHHQRRLTQADVEAILKTSHPGPDLHSQTLRSVWQEVNLSLKGGSG